MGTTWSSPLERRPHTSVSAIAWSCCPMNLQPQISGTPQGKSDLCPKNCYHQPIPGLCRAGSHFNCLKLNSRHPLAAVALPHVSRPQAHRPEFPPQGWRHMSLRHRVCLPGLLTLLESALPARTSPQHISSWLYPKGTPDSLR